MHICIVLIDSLRADHLGCYGYGKKTSPHIDSIADKSAVFANAISQSNWTLPSVYSLLTGRYPSALKIVWWDQKISDTIPVITGQLEKSNYHTALFTPFKALLNPRSFCSHFKESRQIKMNDNITKAFTELIEQHKNSFLLLHIGEFVHEPFFAEEKYVTLFLEEDIDKKRVASSAVIDSLTSQKSAFKNIREIIGKINTRRIRLSREEIKYLLAAYDAGIYCVDELVGQIHNVLKREDSEYIFILTADHGQAFMEHNVFGHGLTLYDELIRVPLIIDRGGKTSANIRDSVQLVDICPTLFELLGIEPGCRFDGMSLAPLLSGQAFPDRACLSEGYPYISIRKKDFKLITKYKKIAHYDHEAFRPIVKSWKRKLLVRILNSLPDQLFHLESDPLEKNNLLKKQSQVYQGLLSEINQIAAGFGRDGSPPEEVGIDDEIKKQLRDLGYM